MRPGARTPEELETLFEDAFVVRDCAAVAALFEEGAVLVMSGVRGEVRGDEEIARTATAMWSADRTYLAAPQRVLQARDTALIVAPNGVNVVRRAGDGTWRYAIALLALDDDHVREEQR
ncbi:MAG TPA: hypothetical protein VMY78_01140 [Solirubrobacteraceae bacterium]|nr:hypothetical protein [Solirubrobacteraceae bacterium]